MEDMQFKVTNKIIAQVVDETDNYLKKVITDYAIEQSKKMGGEIEALFIDKSVADKIIELGTAEYMKRKANNQ